MKQRRRIVAYTLLELLVSMLILYMACSYLMSLFSSGRRFGLRNREYSTTVFLARNKMEYLCCMPADKLENISSGHFTGDYSGYSWRVSLSGFSGNLKLLTLEVESPLRTKTTLRRLVRGRAFMGVACDSFSDQVIWSVPKSASVNFMQSSGSASLQSLSLVLPGISPCYTGALSGIPGRGAVWAACANRPAIGYYTFSSANKLKARYVLKAPAAGERSAPVFAGIAGDSWGNRLYCADVNNGAIWIAQDGLTKNALQWSAESPLRPKKVPLEKPMGLALDEHASILWIAESAARAIRPLYLNSGIKPSGSGTEAAAGVGWWGNRLALPQGTEALQGLAVNSWGSSLFAVDDHHLLILTYKMNAAGSLTSAWSVYSLPSALRSAMPSGLACDPFKNVLYINTSRGELWMASVEKTPAYKRVQ